MSAEILRRAADLMRDRAQHVLDEIANPGVVNSQFPGCPPWIGDAEYIRSWHPTVALAVAVWLDAMASRAESKIAHGGNDSAVWAHERHALTVARAYLGETA
jgi:hypothetical protein